MPTPEQIVAFLTGMLQQCGLCIRLFISVFFAGCGVATSDFDLFEMSDSCALVARERSRVEAQKFTKYHEVGWEGTSGSGNQYMS